MNEQHTYRYSPNECVAVQGMVQSVDKSSSAPVKHVRNSVVGASHNHPALLRECHLGWQPSVEGIRFQIKMSDQAALVNIADVKSGLAIVDRHQLTGVAKGSARAEEYQRMQ